jgi:hypothetical protein
MSKWNKHFIIPDTQVRPGVPISHFLWIGRYIAEKKPDVLIHLGDHWDSPALNDYEDDTSVKANARIAKDIQAGLEAFELLYKGMGKYRPARMVFLLGNHEERFNTLLKRQPQLRGAFTPPWQDLCPEGWRVYPYLQPVVIDGVAYCHQFVKSSNGRVTSKKWGAPNARAQVLREMRSCTAGHKPGWEIACVPAGNRSLYGLIVGSCYQHSEEWLTPQGNRYFRGVVICHEVRGGEYQPMFVSLDYLKRRYA